MKKFVNSSLLKGAFYLTFASFLAKVLGAVYRIPLSNILGETAIGYYQMAFPLYCILLTFSSTGLPTALTKLIAEGQSPELVLKKSLKVFGTIGFIASLIMLVFSLPLASLQGDKNAYLCYVFLSPSVFLVSILSCYRGFFQGKMNMLPTSLSQILEQVIKLIFGLSLCFIFRKNLVLASGLACASVTISEAIASLFMYFLYKTSKTTCILTNKTLSAKNIILLVIPLTLSSILIPLARVIDSFLIINILSNYLDNAIELYGIYSGGVESIIGVPVAICYGISVAFLPAICKDFKDKNIINANNKINLSLILTLVASTCACIFVFVFARLASEILYRRFTTENKIILANCLKISSFSIVFLCLTQTLSSILIARGKLYAPCINLGVGIVSKIVFSAIFLNFKNFNIFATAFSDILCYLVATILNLVYIIYITKKQKEKPL